MIVFVTLVTTHGFPFGGDGMNDLVHAFLKEWSLFRSTDRRGTICIHTFAAKHFGNYFLCFFNILLTTECGTMDSIAVSEKIIL